MTRRPFEQMRFEDLPEAPRVAHDFGQTRAMEREMKSRPFGAMRVHWREYGPPEKEPLLLVHGLMTTSYSWRYVYRLLGARFRVIAPDLPGSGRSDKPRATSYGPEALAEWLGEFQRELGIEGCAAIGNSMGGYLCMHHAMMDPNAYSRLVDIHSPASPDFRYRALGAALSVPGATSLLASLIGKDGRRWTHKNVHYYDETLKSLEEAEEYARPLRTREGVDAFRRYMKETLAPRGFSALADKLRATPFPIPLMLLYATTDPLVPPENGDYLARLVPGAKLVKLERTSHFAHVDTPSQAVDALLPFLS